MDRWLTLAGAVPFILLGVLHIAYSLGDVRRPRRIVPADAGVMEAMRTSTLRLTKETDVWRAWLGFNISHGLGVAAFGCLYAYVAIWQPHWLGESTPLLVAGPLIAAAYAVLSWRFWFSIPLIGSAVGLASFLAATALRL